jgi:hypothetical protein
MFSKTLIIISIVAACQVSYAADDIWEKWGNSGDDNWYVLKDSLEYNQSIAINWMMVDMKKPLIDTNGNQYKSVRVQYEYNCTDRSSKQLYVKGYSDKMGYGTEVFSNYIGYSSRPKVFSKLDWESQGYDKYCKRIWEVWK